MKRIHPSAEIGDDVTVGDGTSIWHLVQIREGASLGRDCVVGRSAYIGPNVRIGDACKIQNNALVYDPAVLGDGVFVGPAVVLTNDVYPRAVNPDLTPKDTSQWEPAGVSVGDGAALGANSVVRAGVRIGRWALVAAGAVVIDDVADFSMVAGNPARHKGWVGRGGRRLVDDGDVWRCPDTGDRFREVEGRLEVVDDG